ncbi:hypothetical protein FQR65_LT14569 [Abscondita terminalis]|nr:hypothetical protein FQR65_LT14569 [Abscondita terminalis]
MCTRELGMSVEVNSLYYISISLIKDLVKYDSLKDEENLQIDDNMIDTSSDNSVNNPSNNFQHFTSLPIETDETDGDALNDCNSYLYKHLCNISHVGVMNDLIIRNYDQKLVNEAVEKDGRKKTGPLIDSQPISRQKNPPNSSKSKIKYKKRKNNQSVCSNSSEDSCAYRITVVYDDSTDIETNPEYLSEYDDEMEVPAIEETIEQNDCRHLTSPWSILVDKNNFYAVYYDEGWFLGKLIRTISYRPKKSKVLTPEDINKFLNEAPDDVYLLHKVILVIGISGACRKQELVNLRLENIENLNSAAVIKIPDTKTNKQRIFTITGKFFDIYKKYSSLRPSNLHGRFFLNYQHRKCTKQPVVDAGGDITALKRHGGWQSTSVAEGYVEESLQDKIKVANTIVNTISEKEPLPSKLSEQFPETSKSQSDLLSTPIPTPPPQTSNSFSTEHNLQSFQHPVNFVNCSNNHITINFINNKQ